MITKEKFYADPSVRIVIEESKANNYCLIKYDTIKIGVAWRDVPKEPEILVIEKYDVILIGAGASTVGVSNSTGVVKFALGVIESFGSFLETEKGFAIISETTITVFSGETFSSSKTMGNDDIILDCKYANGKFIVQGLSGEYIF